MRKLLLTHVMGIFLGFRMSASSQPVDHDTPLVTVSHPGSSAELLAETVSRGEPGENKKDPAYKTYKEGYNAILDEQWDQAIKKFSEVTSRYPKSEYIDDAEYWNAYALSYVNRKKAIDAYTNFMHKYPRSSYVDDALADLGNLNQTLTMTASGDSGVVVVSSSGDGYSYAVAPSGAPAESHMRKAEAMLQKQMTMHSFRVDRLRIPAMASFRAYALEKIDPETKIKMEALDAIAGSKDDEKAFQALKEVALDLKQPPVLRNAALESLVDFKKFDILPLFVDLARDDTSEQIQTSALEYIAEAGKDKNKSVDLLAGVYNATPRKHNRKLQTVLFVIADVGNDKAVDFLANVARADEDYTLRSDAVYYLGSIGGEKARSALFQILRNK